MAMSTTQGPRIDAPQIPGFEVSGLLGQGAMSNVFRGNRAGLPYAIKVMRSDRKGADVDAALRFRREASAIARLDHPGLVKVVEVGEANGNPFLVMELVEGESLEDRLKRGPLSEPELLGVARSVLQALGEVHRHGLMHRDVKPANIILLPSGLCKVIDFGFVGHVEDRPEGEGEVFGTFLYASPEQSGMLKRKVDARSDLYSMGVVLFECATGRVPFMSQNLGELLHMHAAIRPPNAHELNPAVRPVLGKILEKLLAKDPDDRYQTAEGVLADLEQLGDLDSAHKLGRPVQLGSRDSHLRGGFEVPLVGRSAEMAVLGKCWAQAREGQGSMLLIEGEGGSGKTRLVRELIRAARSEGTLVLSGKAQQGERLPFGPLREAVDTYLSSLAKLPPEQQAAGMQRVKAAAGEFGAIVKRLSRSLEAIFADVKDLPPLDPMSEQQRFYEKVADFFAGLAGTKGAAILLVDDVQWLDDGSTTVLRRMAEKARSLPLLIITAARNDPQSDQARQAFVRQMGDALGERITLKPLDEAAVGDLVAAHLGGKRLELSVLQKINARARGNPFAVGEYVRSLLDTGMIRPTFGSWVVDTSRFHEVALSGDVIQLLVNRLQGLSEETRSVLTTAAVIGFEFGAALLTDAAGAKADQIRRALEEAAREGLIERVDVSYRFIHDRVHEAILAALDPARARDIHQAVAHALERLGDVSGPMLHALAQHYARGHAEKHQARIYEVSLKAGVHALESYSNQEAVDLLGRALRAAEIIGLGEASKALVSELLGVACTRVGKVDAAATHFRRALSQAKTKDDRARLSFLLGNAFASKGRFAEAKKEMFVALQLKGASVPGGAFLKVLAILWHLFWAVFMTRTGIGYGSAKGEKRRRREEISAIQCAARWLSLFLNDPLTLMYMTIRELHNVQYLGTCRETAKAHSYYAFTMAIFSLANACVRHAKLGIAMARQLGDPETLTFCEVYFSSAREMIGQCREGQQAQDQVLPNVLRYSTSWEQAAIIAHRTVAMVGQGRSRDVIDYALKYLDVLNRSGHESMQASVFGCLYSQLTMLGRVPDALKAKDQSKRLADLGSQHARSHFVACMIHGLHEQADHGPEIDRYIDEFHKMKRAEWQNRYGYIAAMYARLDQFIQARGREAQAKARQKLKIAIAEANNPPPVTAAPVWRVHLVIMKATLARLDKKYRSARKLLDAAAELANASDSVWGKWRIAYERARLASEQSDEATAKRQADLAVTIARREGWQYRVQAVEREFSTLLRPVEQAQPGKEGVPEGSTVGGGAAAQPQSVWFSSRTGAKVRMLEVERQMETLLQVSLATASSLDPAQQARAALDELVELLGAERAFLFVLNPSTTSLEMQAGRDAEKRDLLALSGFSSTVVNKVWSSGEALVLSGTDEGEALGSESAVVHNLRSIMAAPLMLRDQKLGVIYLDSRLAKGMFGKQHLRILQPICNFIAISLQTGRMARVEAQQKALEKDLALTAAVQSLFLPGQSSYRSSAVGVAGFYRPATQCGGDWWWYDPQGQDGVRVYLGDVTGHGAASAMVTASVASVFQLLRRTGGANVTGDLVQQLGQHLRHTTDGQYNMTFSAVELVGRSGKLRWWNAGSPPLFVLRSRGHIEVVNLPGAPLGSSDAPPGFVEVNVSKGDRVLMFTDGVSELNLPNSKQLGFKRLSKIMMETRSKPIEEIAAALAASLDAARQNTPQEDDITFAVLDVL